MNTNRNSDKARAHVANALTAALDLVNGDGDHTTAEWIAGELEAARDALTINTADAPNTANPVADAYSWADTTCATFHPDTADDEICSGCLIRDALRHLATRATIANETRHNADTQLNDALRTITTLRNTIKAERAANRATITAHQNSTTTAATLLNEALMALYDAQDNNPGDTITYAIGDVTTALHTINTADLGWIMENYGGGINLPTAYNNDRTRWIINAAATEDHTGYYDNNHQDGMEPTQMIGGQPDPTTARAYLRR